MSTRDFLSKLFIEEFDSSRSMVSNTQLDRIRNAVSSSSTSITSPNGKPYLLCGFSMHLAIVNPGIRPFDPYDDYDSTTDTESFDY